jgi:hypothetical protein
MPVIGPNGTSSDNPAAFGDWRAEESSSLGMVGISGRIPVSTYDRAADVYRAGAEWPIFRKENGEMIGWGELTEPILHGDFVELAARGVAHRAEKEVQNLLFQSRSYDDWAPAESEPHSYAVSTHANKHIDMQIRSGRITWRPQKDYAFAGGEEHGAVFWEPDETLTRIAFTVKHDASAEWELVLKAANAYEDGVGDTLTELTTWDLGAVADGTAIDYTVTGHYDLLYLALRKVTTETPTDPPKVHVTKLRVSANGADDDYTASDLVADLGARLGWDIENVQPSGQVIVPFRMERMTFREAFEYACLVTGWRAVARKAPSGTILEFGPWDTRVYTLVDPEATRNLVPLERFDRASVVARYAGGNATKVVRAIADPNPLPDPNPYPQVIELPGRQPSVDQAEVIAQRVADFLAEPRYSGSATFSMVLDEFGIPQPANIVRAGDTLYDPSRGVRLKVDGLTRTQASVTATFLSSIPFIERLGARRARRFAA